MPANDNIKHEGYEHFLELCRNYDMNLFHLSRSANPKEFDNFYWFLRFSAQMKEQEIQAKRQEIKIV